MLAPDISIVKSGAADASGMGMEYQAVRSLRQGDQSPDIFNVFPKASNIYE
jgi:hypothetical protein